MRAAVAALLSWLGLAAAAQAVDCREARFDGTRYSLCQVDMQQDDLRLFLNDPNGRPFGHFQSLQAHLAQQGLALEFAMNGGMYHADRSPVGMYVEDGAQIMRLVPNAGPGNFGLLPNGVLCIGAQTVQVIESLRFRDAAPDCRFASQSGPMLVIDGALHPAFLQDGTSRLIRNGVGTSADGRLATFVMAENPVNFFEFATFFRQGLGLEQALFIDGNVSRLFAPSLGRADFGRPMGPIVGVVRPGP